jgi:FdhE protein
VSISAGARRQLDVLRTAQPEAGPWLSLLTLVLEECAKPAWEAAAAATRLSPERKAATPLLAGATIPLDARLADCWVRRVLERAGTSGPEVSPLRATAGNRSLDALPVLEAALNGDGERLSAMASRFGVDAEAFTAVAGLTPLPLLQALRRHFGPASDPHWSEGYCPVCGDWPLMAEQRGLERARRLRCGRCGADWAQPGIRCPYCGVIGHAARSALVSEQDGEARKVETCVQCRGYLKNVSTLRAWAGDEIPLADLATIDLDLVALERDFVRPAPEPLQPEMRVVES